MSLPFGCQLFCNCSTALVYSTAASNHNNAVPSTCISIQYLHSAMPIYRLYALLFNPMAIAIQLHVSEIHASTRHSLHPILHLVYMHFYIYTLLLPIFCIQLCLDDCASRLSSVLVNTLSIQLIFLTICTFSLFLCTHKCFKASAPGRYARS